MFCVQEKDLFPFVSKEACFFSSFRRADIQMFLVIYVLYKGLENG